MLALFQDREKLAAEQKAWRESRGLADVRLPRWRTMQRLLGFARTIPVYEAVASQAQAIADNRSLLADPDPVAPLCATLTDALRSAIQAARSQYEAAYTDKNTELEASSVWSQLGENDQHQIRFTNGLGQLQPLRVGTEDEVLAAIEGISLSEWGSMTAALASRISDSLLEAQRRLKPKSTRVSLPPASLETVADVDAYLDKVRALILAHIEAGVPVVL